MALSRLSHLFDPLMSILTHFVAHMAVKECSAKKYDMSAFQFFEDNEMTEDASTDRGSFIVLCVVTNEEKQLCGLHLMQGTGVN